MRLALEPGRPGSRSQSDLARELGVKQPSVSEWVRMNARPEAHLRKAVERVLGIPADDWMTDEERVIAETGPPDRESSRSLGADDPDESGSSAVVSDAAKTVASNDSSRKVG